LTLRGGKWLASSSGRFILGKRPSFSAADEMYWEARRYKSSVSCHNESGRKGPDNFWRLVLMASTLKFLLWPFAGWR